MDPLVAIAFLLFGLIFGSFLNVCISRIPRDESVITPRSRCPACKTPIAWRDNIPLLSWILLRGRCRACNAKISLRYPAVELLTAILFVGSYAQFGIGGAVLKACIFCFLVVGLIFTDAETGLLPAEFTYSGICLGLLFAWLVPLDSSGTTFLFWLANRPTHLTANALSLLDSLVGAIVGAGFFFIAWAAYYLIRRRDGLGFGDIAFMAMIGAFLGLKATVLVIFLAPITASVYAIGWLLFRRRDAAPSPPDAAGSAFSRSIPFGIFLGANALVSLFFSHAIWDWYFGLFR